MADPAARKTIMNSPKRLARIDGNAAATAGNVAANSGLVSMDVVAHLLDGTFFVFLAMALFTLLQQVHKSMARAMLALVALATGVICLNAVFMFEGLRVATDGSPINQQGGFPSGSASCSLWAASATSWICLQRSWSPASAKRFKASSSSRQQSRKSWV